MHAGLRCIGVCWARSVLFFVVACCLLRVPNCFLCNGCCLLIAAVFVVIVVVGVDVPALAAGAVAIAGVC